MTSDARKRLAENAQEKCDRCHRPWVGWPLDRGDKCSPTDWGNCIRPRPDGSYR